MNNFEIIESQIKEYKDYLKVLEDNKNRLQEIISELKETRKDTGDKKANEKLQLLNKERGALKEDISSLKKKSSKLFKEIEAVIFKGIDENFSEVYENQLSRLYGVKIDIIFKKLGEDFDEETCEAVSMIATKDKKQHLKIMRTISFGIKNLGSKTIQRKAKVELCFYSKKHKAGTIIQDKQGVLWKNISY